jgi:hypothetical protein
MNLSLIQSLKNGSDELQKKARDPSLTEDIGDRPKVQGKDAD